MLVQFHHTMLSSGLYGRVPQSVIDDEEDFLRHTHSVNYDLVCQ